MSGVNRANSGDPLQPFRGVVHSALESGDINRAIRKSAVSDAYIQGTRSFKERLIEWFPNASRYLGISLSQQEKSANIGAANEFITALSSCVGEEKAMEALGETYAGLSKGLPLTARKVAHVLLAANLGRVGMVQHKNNQAAFQQWYRDAFKAEPSQSFLDRVWASVPTVLSADVYNRDLKTEDFARLVLHDASLSLEDLQSMPGMVFRAHDEDDFDTNLKALVHDEAALSQSLRQLSQLNKALQGDDSVSTELKGQLAAKLPEVQAKLAQVVADLHPNADKVIVLENQPFSEALLEALAADYTEDALGEHPRSSYLDKDGAPTTDARSMLIRAQGFGNDIGRCSIKLNGSDLPRDGDKGAVINALLEAFVEKYGAEKGPIYLKQLSNTLGQALFAGVVTRNVPGGVGPTEAMLAILQGSGSVSYDIAFENNGIRIVADYKAKAESITTGAGTNESLAITTDPSQSTVAVDLDLTFNPEAHEGQAFVMNSSGCRYSHKMVPQVHQRLAD